MPEKPDDPAVLARAKAIFLAARGLGLAEREEMLESECAGDAPLRALVLELLAASEMPLPFESLADDIRAAHEGRPTASVATPGRVPPSNGGDRIGNYRLLERLGEGGFGVVFMAEQERPVRRRVALKIIKLGMDVGQVVARFEAERQALALMDHPGIARVFDGGATETGRPYFVMELVRGLPITQYCDEHKLSIKERLALIAQVCDALQHAHQKGVIHRDIKPGNVLVTESAGKALPKIIDFGIAKATHARLTEKTIFTEFRQMIGTPEYMSPEQAGQSVEDVDTRTDVYSAGVLLYELLTGATPFDSKRLRSAAFGELQRIIREEDPPKPSTRLRTGPVEIGTVASLRGTQPARLSGTIRGELDWIVMKSLEKDRSRRYDSAGAMGRDIQRYLAGEVVQAAPPSKAYLVRKFVLRHKGPVLAASLLALALVAGLVGTSLGFFNAERQRKVAVVEKTRADENAAQARAAEAVATRSAYSANLMSASTAMNSVQYSAARAFLDAAPESLRGWEWRVLHARLDTSVRALHIPRQPACYDFGGLVMHAGGHSFFTLNGRGNPTAQRWDLETGRLLQSFPAPSQREATESIWVVLSPDGLRMITLPRFRLTGSKGIPVDTWDLSTGQQVGHSEIIDSTPGSVHGFASPDGSRVYTYTVDRIRAFDAGTGRVVSEQPLGAAESPRACSPDGAMIASATDRSPAGRMTVRDATSLAPVCVLDGHEGFVTSQVFSSNNRWLGSAADDTTARIWDLSASPPTSLVLQHPFRVGNIRFSPDSSLVATVAVDRAIRIWDRADGMLLGTYATESLDPYKLMFMPDGKTVAGQEADGTVRFWDVTAEAAFVLRGHKHIVSRALFVKGETGLIISSSWEGDEDSPGIVRLWDADSGEQVAAYPGRPGDIAHALAVSADGRFASVGITSHAAIRQALALGQEQAVGRIETLDLATGKVVATATLLRHMRWVAFAGDGRSVVAADDGGLSNVRVHVLDAATGARRSTKQLDPKCVWRFALSPDGRTLAAIPLSGDGTAKADHPRTLLLLDALTLETVREIDGVPEGQYSMTFSPDGTRIAMGSGDGLLRLFDVASGKLLATMSGHGMEILAIAFSPDGASIASAGLDRKVRIWNAATFEQLAAFSGHEGHIGGLDWDAIGERLASCSGDFTIRIWEPAPIRTRVRAREAREEALAQAQPLVARLFDELTDLERVVEQIKATASLTPLVRRTALQVALRRGLEAQASNGSHNSTHEPLPD